MKLKKTYYFSAWLLFFIASLTSFAQQREIKGVVKDDTGVPVPGAAVVVKNSSRGVATDFDGNYTIKATDGETLVFSSTGLKTQERKITKGIHRINITLHLDVQEVGEVVVTGITTTDRRLFTGASDKISASDTKISGISDVSRALEGRSAGVQVQNTSGTFGSAPKIRVRGATSIYGLQKPLWVVDGVILEDIVELSADDLSSGDVTTLISSAIAGLNSDDIESFEILKDGSATSIYGARAMAGVIVVTTKRGKAGVSTFNYTNESTFRLIPTYNEFNIMNSWEQMQVYEEMRNAGWLNYADVATSADSGVYGKMYNLLNQLDSNGNFILPNTEEAKTNFLIKAAARNTNWFKQLFRANIMQNHSVSMSSGSEKASYYGSLSAMIDPGWSLQSRTNRYTGNFNSTFKLSNNLQFNILTNVSYRDQRAPGSLSREIDPVTGQVKRDFDINPYSYALNASRTLDPKEFYKRAYAPFNILHELDNNYMDLAVTDLRFQGELKWKATPKIELNGLGSIKYQNTNIDHHITEFANQANAYRAAETATIRDDNPLLYKDPSNPYALPISILPQGGIYQRTNYSMNSYDFRATASYKDTFKDDHIVNINLGSEINSTNRNRNKFRGWGLQYSMGEIPFYTTEHFKRSIEDNDQYYSIYNTRYRNVAFFGNATYSWKHKYTINGTYRYEGTNKLGRATSARWIPTWNISGAWNVHQEEFFPKLKPISHLTLKASYSLTADRGPSNVTNSLVDLRSGSPWRPFANDRETNIRIEALENSELTYEKKKEINYGIDFGLLNDRINIGLDYYTRHNYDLIGVTNTQGIGGQVEKWGNVAQMRAYGFELSLESTNIKTNHFSWTTSFNYSKAKNKITQLKNNSRVFDLIVSEGFAREGYPARSLFSVPFKGLTSRGLPTFLDQNNEISVSGISFQERDKIDFLEFSGSVDPTDTGSLGNIFKYKGLTLNVYVTYSFGNVVRLTPAFSRQYSDLVATPREFKNRYVVSGNENHTNIPIIATKEQNKNNTNLSYAYNAYNYSTERVAKGDFIRLKEISVGYDFDKDLIKRLGLASLSLKLQGTNLFLLYADKKLNGQDPEFFNAGGVAVPMPKQMTFTLKVGL